MTSSPRPTEQRHVPVLLETCLDLLGPGLETAAAQGRTPIAVDGTLGMGGHAQALLERFPQARLVGIDRDPQARELAGARLAPFGDRFTAFAGTYDQIPQALAALGAERADAILFDLGVSSLQLDERERGFAYSYDAPLDMRMDTSGGITAADLLAEIDERDLIRILRDYGQERFAPRIARGILRARDQAPIEHTGQLVEIIRAAVPAAAQQKGHPAKQTFQALRIEVNQELSVLEAAVPAAVDALSTGARVVAMSYHSLEDRIVKQTLAGRSRSTAPKGMPVELEEHRPVLRMITRGTHVPSAQEIAQNPRAASARLRAAERIREGMRA